LTVKRGRESGTATVLFTDPVGSTELMSRMGEVAFDELRQAHFAALRSAIEKVGGEEIKRTGDGPQSSRVEGPAPTGACL
jgi:class 3 adenylate cyclase